MRLERWRRELAEPSPRRTTLTAELDGRIVAFGSACAPTEAVFEGRGEIRWLHVDPAMQGRGVGRTLMAALADELAGWGYRGCALAVVVGNHPAMAFYERLGGRKAGGYVDPGPLWRSENVVFVWDELGTTDADGAQRFYEEVFGWTTKDMGEDFGGYRIFDRPGGTGQGVAGLMQNQDATIPAAWTPYVGVEDTDACCAKAKELGASAVVEPMDVPTVGRFAILKDPQGAVFGIIKGEPQS